MRNGIIKLLALLISVLTVFTFAACDNGGESSEAENSEVSKQEIGDNSVYYGDIAKTLKLSKSFEGKSFLTDGIGKATVSAFTDGDTTRFKLESGEVIVIRYYQVDTPESTSSIEKWGKAASNFTKSRLSEATEIVLEATADRAEHDSYGTRYLGYVWYKTEANPEFVNLNLEIVENGFSENKGINTGDYPYYSYFLSANNFAKRMQLRLYSKLDDPLFSTDPVELSLKEFLDNPDLYYNADTDTGAKVKLVAALTSLYVSNSGTYTFTATDFDEETGETLTINVYAGYTSSAASNMKLGHLYTIVGNLQKYGGKFQISGLNYNTVYQIEGGDYTTITQKDYYLTFNSDTPFIMQYSNTLYSDVTVDEVKLEGETLTVKGFAFQKAKDGYKGEKSEYTFKISVPEGYENKLKAGSKFSVTGYQLVEGSGEILVPDYGNLNIK